MKKYILAFCIAACGLTFTSCEDNLDVTQHGATPSSSYYSTDQECLEGLSAAYHYLEVSWLNSDFFVNAVLSDDCYTGGGARGNDGPLEELNELRHTADNSWIKTLFQTYYNTIYRCNMLISNIPTEGQTAIMKRCLAEAKVLRAFTYLRLASYFGECPLVLEEVKDGQYAKPNASLSEIYAQIELDLTDAINSGSLLEKSVVTDQLVNVSKQCAQGLLGKAYIYESTFLNVDKWKQAREVLNAVINSGKYDLFRGKYRDQFHIDNYFSSESLLETNRILDPQNAELIGRSPRLGWRTERFKPAQYLATQASGQTECAVEAYGFFNPTKELYDAFVEMEGENGYRLNEVIITYKQLNAMPLQIDNGNSIYGNAGYFMLKLMPKAKERMSAHKIAQNYVLFRYSEVLLLAAEAELPAHGGSQALVDKYMNLIKERAGIVNRPGNYSLQDIQKEKRLELCYEGTRYPDLVRWGLANSVLADKGKKIPTLFGLADNSDNTNAQHSNSDGYNVDWYQTASSGYQAKHAYLPIPQAELDVNQLVTQHDGW